MSVLKHRTVLLSAHRACDDALRELFGYQEMYPAREFEVELRDDGRPRPWRVTMTLRRRGPRRRRLARYPGRRPDAR